MIFHTLSLVPFRPVSLPHAPRESRYEFEQTVEFFLSMLLKLHLVQDHIVKPLNLVRVLSNAANATIHSMLACLTLLNPLLLLFLLLGFHSGGALLLPGHLTESVVDLALDADDLRLTAWLRLVHIWVELG